MAEKSNFQHFLKYASLNVLGMLGISCYILADTFFVANGIGTNGLAALNLAIPIYSFVHGVGLMLGSGGATKFTIANSQGEHQRANVIFTNTMLSAFIFAALFVIIGLFASTHITVLLKASPELFEMTNTYLKVILLFSPFFIFNEVLLSYIRNDGAPGLAMTAMVAGSTANIILDYIFIYPMQMGIFGAVLATGIAPIISMAILSIHKIKHRNQFQLVKCSIQSEAILGSMILGFPSFVTEISAGIVMIVFNTLLLNLVGNLGVAAYGIVANIALVTTAIFTGIAQGVQPLLSNSFGKNHKKAIQQYGLYAMLSVALLSIVIYGGIFFFNETIAALFNSEKHAALQAIASQGLQLYFTSLPFVGFNIILSAYFTSTDNPLPAHIITMLRGLILVLPTAYMLSTLFELNGIWLTITLTECITALIGIYILIKQPNK